MIGSDPAGRTLADLAQRVRSGTLAASALVEHYLDRIDRYNGTLHAYITVAHDAARQAAAGLPPDPDAARPLFGIPYAAKDLFATRGIRTTGGSRVLADWVPDEDATVIGRAAASGAVLLGKTNLHEFAHGALGENAMHGTPPNPFDPTRLAGGSSSGSAVAVACGLAAFALGTDTGGSARIPAALCGIVGFKPSFGLVSRHNVIPYSWSLDHVGLLTRRVADAALVLGAIAGYDPADPHSTEAPSTDFEAASNHAVAGLRVGLPRRYYADQGEPAVVDAVDRAAARAETLGCSLQEIDFPEMALARTVSLTVQMPEVLSYHRRYLPERLPLYGADMRSGLAFGQFMLAEHYVHAKRMIARYRHDLAAVFDAVDLLVLPTCPIVAPPIGSTVAAVRGREGALGDVLTRFTGLFNMTGNPALSVPCGLDPTGLPIGLQIVGRPYEDAAVLRLGLELEAQLGLLSAAGWS